MNLFRVRGIRLAVHFSFFLLLALVAWQGWVGEDEQPGSGGWPGLLVNVVLLLLFFTCVVLHELGHSFTAMRFGVGVRRILLMPIGGMAEFDSIPREPERELLITLAGPAVNFAIAGALYLVAGVPEGWGLFRFDYMLGGWRDFAQVVLHWNLLMGLFNLLPAFPMDGGRIVRALLATRLPYVRATFFAASLGKIVAVLGVIFALTWWDRPLTAVLFTFIFFAGEVEYRATVRRERDDAHWRAVVARFYAAQRAEDPPLLSR